MGFERPRRSLRRVDRLRTSREFQQVSHRGRRVVSRRFVLLMASTPGSGSDRVKRSSGRIGLTVSRRVGGAVVRNRVKRRLREWFRGSRIRDAGPFDWVVIARPGAQEASGLSLTTELDGLCRAALGGPSARVLGGPSA